MHYRYYSTKLQVFQEYLAPRRVLVLIQVGVAWSEKIPSAGGALGVMLELDGANIVLTRTGICSALQGFRHGSVGAMFRIPLAVYCQASRC